MPNHSNIDLYCEKCNKYMCTIDSNYDGPMWTTCDSCRQKTLKENKRLRCKLNFHKWKDKEIQITKRACFGIGSGAPPGMRLRQECFYCKEKRYINLNLCMPNKYLYGEHLWK